ncbi:MAG: hypothetical protein AB8H80_07135 [Planctomycetota bacterium]
MRNSQRPQAVADNAAAKRQQRHLRHPPQRIYVDVFQGGGLIIPFTGIGGISMLQWYHLI